MNKQQSDARLDELLRRWADARQEAGDLDRLQERILAARNERPAQDAAGRPQPSADLESIGKPAVAGLLTEPPDRPKVSKRGGDLRSPVSAGSGDPRRAWAAWFAAGAIAATVVALCGYSLLGPQPHDPDGAGRLPPEFAWLQASELAEKVVLANEMDRLFGARFQWIGETNNRVLLEVGQSDAVGEDGAPPSARLAVRVIAVRRGADEDRWTPVWAADVVTRQEQVVRLPPDPAGSLDGADFSLWAYALEDGVIAVDSELSLGGVSLKSTFNGLQRSGVPVAVHAVEQDAVQYRVFQTVVILDGEV